MPNPSRTDPPVDELAELIGKLLVEHGDPRIATVAVTGFAPVIDVYLKSGDVVRIDSSDFEVFETHHPGYS